MTYPTRTGIRPGPAARAQVERAAELTGSRTTDQSKQAITRETAAKLGEYALKAAKVTSAPSADQHNALIDDLRAIAAILNAMGASLTGL